MVARRMRPVHVAVAGILTLALAVVGIVAQGILRDYHEANESVRARLAFTLSALVHEVGTAFDEALLASASIGHVASSGIAPAAGPGEWQALLRAQLSSHRNVVDLRLRDPSGELVAHAGPQPLRSAAEASAALQQQRARGVEVEWRSVEPGEGRVQGAAVLSRLLTDRHGVPAGFAIVEIPYDVFVPSLERTVDGHAARAMLFDASHRVLASNARAGGAGLFLESVSGFGAEADAIVSSRPVGNLPFGVAISVDRHDAFLAWNRSANQRAALAAAVALVSAYLALVLLRADRASRRAATRERVLGWAVENSASSVLIADAEARIEYANPRASEVSGYSQSDLLGRTPHVFASGHTLPEVYREMWSTLRSGHAWSGVLENRRRDGSALWERTRITPVLGDRGAIEHFVAIKDDVTDEQQALIALQQAAAVFEHSSEAMMVADAEGRIRRVNAAFERVTGYEAKDIVERPAALLVSPEHSPGVFERMRDSLATSGQWQGELWNRHRDGHIYVVQQSTCAIRAADGRIAEYVTLFSDISERKRSEEEMRQRAYYDKLTGLPNRALLLERATQALALSRRQGACLGILFLDVDGLKKVNDTHGHPVGDELLVETGRRIRAALRDSDTVARFGGDEFVAIAPQVKTEADVAAIAHSILDALARPFFAGGATLALRASVGYAISGPDDRLEALIEAADEAMYAAKRDGGGRVRSRATTG